MGDARPETSYVEAEMGKHWDAVFAVAITTVAAKFVLEYGFSLGSLLAAAVPVLLIFIYRRDARFYERLSGTYRDQLKASLEREAALNQRIQELEENQLPWDRYDSSWEPE